MFVFIMMEAHDGTMKSVVLANLQQGKKKCSLFTHLFYGNLNHNQYR